MTSVTPVPGSLNGFTDEQLVAIIERLRAMRRELGEGGMQAAVLDLLPSEESPVWDQVSEARAAHEAAKPAKRTRKTKTTEKE